MSGSVLVAMSGGVDSSVAAAILLEAGWDVVGVTMKLHDDPQARGRRAGCCTVEDADDARAVAARLDIPYYVLDLSGPFLDGVVAPFAEDYAAGRTPNPCVECNRVVKFTELAERADALGIDAIATGHYARLHDGDLYRGVDAAKDQSYVLACVEPSVLSRVLLPIGELHKGEVRARATDLGLRTADKAESMEVCFLGPDGKDPWLRRHLDLEPGPVVDPDGRQVGTHDGAGLYTVGQRRGLGVAVGRRAYVQAVDTSANVVTVGPAPRRATALTGGQAVWPAESPGCDPFACAVQMSAHGRTYPAIVTVSGDGADSRGAVAVTFDRAVPAPAPGQLAAFYDGSRVLGSAVVSTVRSA